MQIDPELYREEVTVASGVISFIEVAPEKPVQTIVFLHGFGGNATQWQYQIEAFAERNRVLVPDLRGHGQSGGPHGDYSVGQLLDDLNSLLDARQIDEPFVLVGHSFGGALAVEFALKYADRVSKLILIASAGEYRLIWPYRIAFRLPEVLLEAAQPFMRGIVDASVISLRRMFHQALKPWRGWDKFAALQMPVMVIRGERDRLFPQAAFTRVSELIPDAEEVNVGASAHMVMIERRDAVNRAIERFIDDDGTAQRHVHWRSDRTRPPQNNLLLERPWLLHYESGVPHTIDIPQLPLTRLLERAARRFPSSPALLFDGRTIRYRELRKEVTHFASALASLGVGKGTRVMLLLPNVPHFVIAYYGALWQGAIVVMSNPLAEPAEIVRQARESGAEVLVTLTRWQETAGAVRTQTGVRTVIYGQDLEYTSLVRRLRHRLSGKGPQKLVRQHDSDYYWHTLMQKAEEQVPISATALQMDDPAVIQYTGGTTARPKGVTLSHRNLMANTVQTRVWLPDARDGGEVLLCAVPFSHVYGMTAAMNVAVAMAAAMVLLPRFETREVLEHIRRYRPTLFPGVPSMYMAINTFPGVRRFDVESIRACISGAAPLPIEVKEAFEKLTKGRLVEGYGLSEAGPVTHANPVFGRDKVGSIGIPLPNTEAKIVDLRTDIPLTVPTGQIGELMVRGPQVMLGYWQNERATRRVLNGDGWLRTGDVARMDEDGYFQIISRRQEMWQTEDASPAFPRDVEEVIYELPEVLEVVVVAIANRPIAFVQLKEGAELSARTIIAFARRRLPEGQVPRLVIFVKEFPRSFIGKVLRRELISQYAQEIEAGAGTVGEHLWGVGE